MGGLLRRQRQLAVKLEVTEGTAETVAAADADLTIYNLAVDDQVDIFDLDPHRATLSRLKGIPGLRQRRFSFEVDIKGSGAVATAPSMGKVFKICGYKESAVSSLTIGAITGGPFQHGETITGGTSAATAKVIKRTANGVTTLLIKEITGTFSAGSETITGATSGATATETGGAAANKGFDYTMNSVAANVPTATIASYEDGKRKQGIGARGNLRFQLRNGQPGRFLVDLTSVLNTTTDVALLTGIAYQATVPVPYLSAGLVMGAFNPLFTSVEIDSGNTVALRENANAVSGLISALITDRNPSGTLDPEAELIATKDWMSELLAATTNYFETTIALATPVPGNKVTIIAPAVQIVSLGDGDRSGIALDQLGLRFPTVTSTGDDELSVLFE